MEFTDTQLIESVKCYPEIYDSNKSDFKLPEKKERAWQMIGNFLGSSADECRKRWRTLRERYTRELKRVKVKEERGEIVDATWKHFDSMEFLHKHIKYRRSQKPDDSTKPIVFEYEETNWNVTKSEVPLPVNITKFEPTQSNDNYNQTKDNFVEGSVPDHTFESPPEKYLKRSPTSTHRTMMPPQNEDELFCSAIACSLKKLSRIHNIKAKTEIYQVLTKYVEKEELGE